MRLKIHPRKTDHNKMPPISDCSECIHGYFGSRIVTTPPKYEEGDPAEVYWMAICTKTNTIVRKLKMKVEDRQPAVPIPDTCPLEDVKE